MTIQSWTAVIPRPSSASRMSSILFVRLAQRKVRSEPSALVISDCLTTTEPSAEVGERGALGAVAEGTEVHHAAFGRPPKRSPVSSVNSSMSRRDTVRVRRATLPTLGMAGHTPGSVLGIREVPAVELERGPSRGMAGQMRSPERDRLHERGEARSGRTEPRFSGQADSSLPIAELLSWARSSRLCPASPSASDRASRQPTSDTGAGTRST